MDLNVDLGECERGGEKEEVLDFATSASICCGAHAGSEDTILAAIRAACRRGVTIGAHPGYPDRESFGRKPMALEPMEIRDLILRQVENLACLSIGEGVMIRYLKPHGALYNQAQADGQVAYAVVNAAQILGVPVLGMPGSALQAEAASKGVRMVREGFLDRRYGPDGRLLPRESPGAVIEDAQEIAAQTVMLLEQGVETLCVHGDNPRCAQTARAVRALLESRGVLVRALL